ncbi:Hypothetical predicted protein [Paramuricea clavata]|uniref:Uncharacterized protein n=1 Tax=Paramuricea clavata TaxID=317549 RepID=A0A6S7J5W9_PARCT|nr:Hypothetical predicted protein [Paramuricea clavata]
MSDTKECKTQPPPPTVVCSQNCNKCMANTTSRMLYYTLVEKLDERALKRHITENKPTNNNGCEPESHSRKLQSFRDESPDLFDDDFVPNTPPKRNKKSIGSTKGKSKTTFKPIKFVPSTSVPGKLATADNRRYTATAKCKLAKRNVVPNVNALCETHLTMLGPYSDINKSTKAIYLVANM